MEVDFDVGFARADAVRLERASADRMLIMTKQVPSAARAMDPLQIPSCAFRPHLISCDRTLSSVKLSCLHHTYCSGRSYAEAMQSTQSTYEVGPRQVRVYRGHGQKCRTILQPYRLSDDFSD